MAGRKKRKFNWDELSSEEDEVEKKVLRKDKKDVEDQAKKLDQLSVSKSRTNKEDTKLKDADEEMTQTRSTRGSKRKIDEVDLKSKSKSNVDELPKKETRSLKEERISDESPKIKTAKLTVKEKSSPKATKYLKPSPKDTKASRENIPIKETKPLKELKVKNERNEDDLEKLNVLPDKKVKSENQSSDPQDDFNLPAINIKPIHMKLKKQESAKKFNKQHLSPTVTPTKARFCEIKIELNDEQRDWFNKQLEKYDGQYDREFDAESDLYLQAVNARKRRY